MSFHEFNDVLVSAIKEQQPNTGVRANMLGGKTMSAYSELYLEDATELQETLFQEIVNEGYKAEHFLEGYMKCLYRKLMDGGNARVINMPYCELISYIRVNCGEILILGQSNIDTLQFGWIGRMYNLLQYKLAISSEELYNKLPLDDMKVYFRPLHTVSDEVALDKLILIVEARMS